MLKHLLSWVLLGTAALGADWSPPADPKPLQILYEAQADARSKRYQEALEKHVWYHHNALKHDPAHVGLRVTIALLAWKDLAAKYPPAMKQLKEERDLAKKNVQENQNLAESMLDLAGLNHVLNDDKQTSDVFQQLDREHPESAAQAYPAAEDALYKNKQYELCNKYSNPEEAYKTCEANFQITLDLPKQGPPNLIAQRSSERFFTTKSARIIALLVINKRNDEAAPIAAKAKEKLKTKVHLKAIDAALSGKMPAPLP